MRLDFKSFHTRLRKKNQLYNFGEEQIWFANITVMKTIKKTLFLKSLRKIHRGSGFSTIWKKQ
jgi:hypothetical protein